MLEPEESDEPDDFESSSRSNTATDAFPPNPSSKKSSLEPGISSAASASPSPSSPKASAPDSIEPNPVSDQPTTKDFLGFKPYVLALAAFLESKKTQPPLTLSIEGEWGSGKSSFMLQLQEALRLNSPNTTIVSFNAWRYDKQDEVWAAFAMVLTRSLRGQAKFWRRLRGDIKLFFLRVNGVVGWTRVVIFCLLWFLVLIGASATFVWALRSEPAKREAIVSKLLAASTPKAGAEAKNESGAGGGEPHAPAANPAEHAAQKQKINIFALLLQHGAWAGSLSVVLAALGLIGKWVRSRMLDTRLERYLDRPDYKGHAAFIDNFSEDFAKTVSAYAGPSGGKVYVFIDDLDRCDVPRSADLMQAINLMIGEGSKQLIFILGIDREKVAAGITQKYKDLLSFLPEYGDKPENLTARERLYFGYSFLEKFIQLSLRIPILDDDPRIATFLEKLTADPEAPQETGDTAKSVESPPAEPDFEFHRIETTGESIRIRNVVLMVRRIFRNNPRRLKLFLNSYRLSVYLASSQGLLDISRRDNRAAATLEQLGKFVALTARYPDLIQALRDDNKALAAIERSALAPQSVGTPTGWADKEGVRDLMRYGLVSGEDPWDADLYSLESFPVDKLLSLIPLAPSAPPRAAQPEPTQSAPTQSAPTQSGRSRPEPSESSQTEEVGERRERNERSRKK